MSLAAGTRFGPYEIVEPIGAGGMGEVYKGRDTRLDRTIAIKILPELHAAEPQFRERFEREARALSQLTHPHICTLHDVGEHGGTPFLVMEFLVGETLAARLERGPLALSEALTTAIEIAEALDVAHRAGIVHRDLKPGNVILTKKGAKLLDFGLAKLRASGHGPVAGVTAAVTGTAPLTGQGSILGTLQYMSPEQLEGKDADARSDVFAFGAIVYEMVTGKRAFEAASQASLIAAILKDTPPPMTTKTVAPPALDRIVRTCLAKDPDERWQSAGDLKRELQWIAASPAESIAATAPAAAPSSVGVRLGWGAIGLIVGSAAAGFLVWRLARPAPVAPAPVTRLSIALPADAPIDVSHNRPSIALSADGSRLAYVATRNDTTQLYIRALDQTEARTVPGTEGASNPFFSPDGQWLGFLAENQLKKVSLNGGSPVTICSSGDDAGPTWGPDDVITFVDNSGLMQVSASGGTPRSLTKIDAQRKETEHIWPSVLPGGEALIFNVWTGESFDDTPIVLQSLKTGERHDLGLKGTFARYAPTGHLIYARAGSIFAAPFDLQRLAVTGAAVPIVEGVLTHVPSGAAQFAFADNGVLVYLGTRGPVERAMVWVDRRGGVQPLSMPAQPVVYPRISPDDQRIVFANGGAGGVDLWVHQIARDTPTRLTFDHLNIRPIWSADGTEITFTSSRAGPLNIHSVPADGSAAPRRILESAYTQFPNSWSPDGRYLGFTEIHPETNWDLWVLARGDRTPQPFLKTPFSEGWMEFSPNGRWVAYTSNESGRWEVYVRPFPGPGGKVQISSEGGTEAVWSRNGRELFYRNRARMMAVAVSMEPTFSAAKPRLLFEGRYEMGVVSGMINYDVSRDGERFLMLKSSGAAEPPLDVVLNWFSELSRRAPSGKIAGK